MAVLAALAYAAGAKLAAPHTQKPVAPAPRAQHPAQLTTVTGSSETAFMTAVLRDLDAPPTDANIDSLARWAAREGAWGTVGANNPFDTTLAAPGATNFNTFRTSSGAILHVRNYPTATEGAYETAVTLKGGFPNIVDALRSGRGLRNNPGVSGDLSRWSGGAYKEIS